MILDTLENAAKYAGIRSGLSEAFGFLDQPGLAELETGRYEISGDLVYALVQRCNGKKIEEARLEAHRKYIDIQYVISGEESMGWSPRAHLAPSDQYDEKKDVEFFPDRPEAVIKVPAGSFAVFLPTDAHMPCIGEGSIHKVVMKVCVC